MNCVLHGIALLSGCDEFGRDAGTSSTIIFYLSRIFRVEPPACIGQVSTVRQPNSCSGFLDGGRAGVYNPAKSGSKIRDSMTP